MGVGEGRQDRTGLGAISASVPFPTEACLTGAEGARDSVAVGEARHGQLCKSCSSCIPLNWLRETGSMLGPQPYGGSSGLGFGDAGWLALSLRLPLCRMGVTAPLTGCLEEPLLCGLLTLCVALCR